MENWVWLYFLPENCLGLSLGHLVHQLVLPRALLAAPCWSRSWCPRRRRRPARPGAQPEFSTARPGNAPPRLAPLAPAQDPPMSLAQPSLRELLGKRDALFQRRRPHRAEVPSRSLGAGKSVCPGSAPHATRSRSLSLPGGSLSGSPGSWEPPLGPLGDPTL